MDLPPTLGGTPLGPPSAVEALLVSRAESFAGAFVLASSVPTVVTAFVDIDPTLGGTPLGPPSAAGALAGPAFFSLLITSCTTLRNRRKNRFRRRFKRNRGHPPSLPYCGVS